MLNKLILENFQKHAHLEVEFSNGVTLITGNNYRGKSTILRAILYALFGPAAVPGTAASLPRRGSDKKQKVTLFQTIGESQYELCRSPSTTYLRKDGQSFATGATAVTQEIEKLLGLSSKLFCDLRVAHQDESGTILTLGADKISGILHRVTGVDLVDRVTDRVAREALQVQAQLKMTGPIDVEAAQQEVHAAATELNTLYALGEQLKISAAGFAAQETAAKTQYEGLLQQNEAHHEASKASSELTGKISLLQENLAKTSEPAEVIDVSKEFRQEIETLSSGISEMRQELLQQQRREARLTILKEAAETDLRKSLELSKVSQRWTEYLDTIDQSIFHRETEIAAICKDATSDVEAITQLIATAVCPTCSRPFEGADPDALQTSLKAAEKRASEAFALAAEIAPKVKEYREYFASAEIGHAQAAAAKQAAEASQSLYKAEQSQARETPGVDQEKLTSAEQALARRQEELLRHQHALQEYLRAKQTWNRLVQDLSSAELTLRSMQIPEAVNKEDLANSYALLQTAIKSSQAATAALSAHQTDYGWKYRQYQDKEAFLQELTKQAAELQALQKEGEILTALTKYLRGNRNRFVQRIWDSILGYASDFAAQVTNGAITEISRTDTGDFLYAEAGEWMPVTGGISGFQRAVLGVGVRLALAEAVRTTESFVLFDEVTAGASPENSMSLIQALGATGTQIITVTHRDEDAAVADSVVHLS